MKKIILFLGVILLAINFSSCSSDDDDSDKIIGKWGLSQMFLNDEEIMLSDCEKQMTIEVFENETFIEKDFEEDESTCTALAPKNGLWKNLGNSMYQISDIGVPQVKVTFDGNKASFEYSETEDGITYTVKVVFIKLN